MNTTKLLISVLLTLTALAITLGVWIIIPPHSGVALSVGLFLMIVVGLLIGFIYDPEPAY